MPVSVFHGMIINLEYESNIPYIVIEYKEEKAYFNIEGDFVKGIKLPELQKSCIEAWMVIEKEAIRVNFEKLSNNEEVKWIQPLDL